MHICYDVANIPVELKRCHKQKAVYMFGDNLLRSVTRRNQYNNDSNIGLGFDKINIPPIPLYT